ncbi:MAG: hypothetical protein CUN55_19770, partial [Phototrophicales bacterium]
NSMARSLNQELLSDDHSQALLAKSSKESEDDRTHYLVFKAGKGAPKAVPLELVYRLEEFPASQIESASHHPVVQYQQTLLRLHRLNREYAIATSGIQPVIIFEHKGEFLGIAVEAINDITHAPIEAELASN